MYFHSIYREKQTPKKEISDFFHLYIYIYTVVAKSLGTTYFMF